MAEEAEKQVDLVLEGGGVKGIALVGAITVLAEAGYSFPRVSGTSAGAIVASMVAAYQKAKRDLSELVDVMMAVDNSRFAEWRAPGMVAGPAVGAVDLLRRGGLHPGHYIYEFLTPALEKVGVTTFADLPMAAPDSSSRPSQRYSLVLHVSDLTRKALVRLPWDYPDYGRDPDRERIVDAVRASMAIPFFFTPVTVETGRGTATWVDGGLLANFPITVFDRTDGQAPRWPTWGVKVTTSPRRRRDRRVRTAPALGVKCLETMTGDWYRSSLGLDGAGRRTIAVDTSGVSITDFDLDDRTRVRMFQSGRAAATAFLERLPDRHLTR